MNNKQQAKLNMYGAVISFCNQNTDVINSIPGLQKSVDTFKETTLSIESITKSDEMAIPGITLDKKQLRENLAQIAAHIALKTFAYADETGNNELKARINFTKSELLKLKDKELPGICKSIVEQVKANLPALAEYNITEASLTELNDAIKAYEAYVSLPRNAASEISINVLTLATLFKKGDEILRNRMDKIITTLSVVNLQFQQLYFRNRAIFDAHTTYTQIKGVVIAKDKDEPLRGVIIKVIENGKTISSNGDGKYVLKPMTPGIYSIEASKKGYVSVIISNIDVKLGQITRRDIGLSPEK